MSPSTSPKRGGTRREGWVSSQRAPLPSVSPAISVAPKNRRCLTSDSARRGRRLVGCRLRRRCPATPSAPRCGATNGRDVDMADRSGHRGSAASHPIDDRSNQSCPPCFVRIRLTRASSIAPHLRSRERCTIGVRALGYRVGIAWRDSLDRALARRPWLTSRSPRPVDTDPRRVRVVAERRVLPRRRGFVSSSLRLAQRRAGLIALALLPLTLAHLGMLRVMHGESPLGPWPALAVLVLQLALVAMSKLDAGSAEA